MALSLFTTVTDPQRRGDLWLPAIQCYSELADEVIIVDGSTTETLKDLPSNCKVIKSKWDYEFKWDLIGKQFTKGYRACTSDWVIYVDLDMIFHEKDFNLIKRIIQENPNLIALSTWKYMFIQPDRYYIKSRLVNVINKKLVGERISFDAGGDLCRPSIDGSLIKSQKTKEMGVPVYCYDKMWKTYEQVFDDVGRMARAWEAYFGNTELGKDSEEAFDIWASMLEGRFKRTQNTVKIEDHPQYMIPYILMLQPKQFGYSGFDMFAVNSYVKGMKNA